MIYNMLNHLTHLSSWIGLSQTGEGGFKMSVQLAAYKSNEIKTFFGTSWLTFASFQMVFV